MAKEVKEFLDFETRFREDHPNTAICDRNFGVLGQGSLVDLKESDGSWRSGIVEKILYAIKEKQVTFFVRVGYGLVCSLPHREGEKLLDLRPKEGPSLAG